MLVNRKGGRVISSEDTSLSVSLSLLLLPVIVSQGKPSQAPPAPHAWRDEEGHTASASFQSWGCPHQCRSVRGMGRILWNLLYRLALSDAMTEGDRPAVVYVAHSSGG